MNESFLHFIWQFQYFTKDKLQTTAGQNLLILRPGRLNNDSGADFQDARIVIGELEWIGSIEIHLKSSDWYQHTHQNNPAYGNVILHVVWENDQNITYSDQTYIPTLELQTLTDKNLLVRYGQFLGSSQTIPCHTQFVGTESIYKLSMLDKAMSVRLKEKAEFVSDLFQNSGYDWEETTYKLMAKNFGFHINAESFFKIAERLPLRILKRHRDNLFQLEALLFGMAGFLEESPKDEYHCALQKEYDFLKIKYGLADKQLLLHEWKFLRLRPSNFPTVRLAQFARIIQENINLFSVFLHLDSLATFKKLLRVEQSLYWQNHYVFGNNSNQKVPVIGLSSVENLLINTVVPLTASYSIQKNEPRFLTKSIRLLEELPAEKNTISESWKELGLNIQNAFDSQAGIKWYKDFCSQKKCLQCDVGIQIMKKSN